MVVNDRRSVAALAPGGLTRISILLDLRNATGFFCSTVVDVLRVLCYGEADSSMRSWYTRPAETVSLWAIGDRALGLW